MKFVVDVCVSHRVVEGLRGAGHEGTLVYDRDPQLGDEEIMRWADRERIRLITNDKDFGRHIFLRQKSHSGLIRLPNARGDVLVALTRQVLDKHQQDLIQGSIITVTIERIRVRSSDR